jgi:imidazolonepropionase-like amidohydrolase
VKSEGADFVKVYNLLSRDSFFAVAAEAKALGLPFAGHLPYAVRADEASDAGQLSIEHMDGILWASSDREEEIRRLLQDWDPRPGVPTTPVSAAFLRDSFDEGKVRALADHFKKNQTAVVPTLSLYWNRFERRTEHSVVASDDRLRYVPGAYSARWKQQLRSITSDDDDRGLFEQSLIVVRELHKAGVTILPGTDVGTAFQLPGFSLHDELSLLVKAGLSEMQTLQAATRNPARAFNLKDQGTIEPGMRADLVLLESNPLADIDNTRKIRTVVAGGRVFERDELDAMLLDIRRAANEWPGTPTR